MFYLCKYDIIVRRDLFGNYFRIIKLVQILLVLFFFVISKLEKLIASIMISQNSTIKRRMKEKTNIRNWCCLNSICIYFNVCLNTNKRKIFVTNGRKKLKVERIC